MISEFCVTMHCSIETAANNLIDIACNEQSRQSIGCGCGNFESLVDSSAGPDVPAKDRGKGEQEARQLEAISFQDPDSTSRSDDLCEIQACLLRVSMV